MKEDEMVGWCHLLIGYEFEQTPGEGEGQGSLMCCSPWSRKESGKTWRLVRSRGVTADLLWFSDSVIHPDVPVVSI